MFPLLLALSAAALFEVANAKAGAPTFYVSSSTGSDANSGLDPQHPWASLARVASLPPNTLQAGSSVLLLSGDEFVTETAWFLTGLVGINGSPITISSYTLGGGGSVERPRIVRSASGPTPRAGPTLTINNSSGIVVAGLEIEGGENGVAFTHDLRAGELASTYAGFAVLDCVFLDIQGLHYNASSGSWWGSAVAFAAQHAGVTVKDVTIANNLVNNSDVFYINDVPYGGFTRSYVVGLNISANTITHASYNTLFLDTTAFVLIADNVFSHDTPSRLFTAGTTDIILGTLNSSVSLVRNEISWRGEYAPGGPDGCAIDTET